MVGTMAKIDDSVKKKVPELRFKGFTDDWEERKAKEMIKTHNFRSYLAQPNDVGNYEVIQQGDKPIAGYANGEPFEYFYDVTLFGDHTVSLFKPTKPFFIATDGVKIISADEFDGRYFYVTLERYKPASQGYKRHFTILKNEDIWFTTNKDEQVKIGTFFKQLDETIALHQRKLDLLKEQKKGYLQKMFPKNGAKVPELRFAGFADDWEERKLIEVADYRNGKAHEKDISEYGDYIVVNSKFVSTNGLVKKYSDEMIAPLSKNEIAFVLSDVPNGRAIARTFLINEDNKYSLNQRIAGITPHADTNSYFLHSLMNRNHYFLRFDDGVSQTNLSKKEVEKWVEFYPSYEEQQKIGSFFKQLDETIALHQRKLDLLKEQKKGFLQKMFV